MDNKKVFNDMVSKTLSEFHRNPDNDVEIPLPLPKVFVTEGVSFLMECFQFGEVVKSIGYALITNSLPIRVDTIDPWELFQTPPVFWIYTIEDQAGTLRAFDIQTYEDSSGYPQTSDAIFFMAINDEPLNLDKVEFFTKFDDKKGAFIICLLNEEVSSEAFEDAVPEPSQPAEEVPVFSEIPGQDIPF